MVIPTPTVIQTRTRTANLVKTTFVLKNRAVVVSVQRLPVPKVSKVVQPVQPQRMGGLRERLG